MFSDPGHKEPDILSVMCYVARLTRKSASAFFSSLAGSASCGSELRMNDYPVVEPSTPSPRNEMLRDVAIVFGCNLQNF